MKSLRELRTDLTGIRLQATNVSLWNLAATVDENARRAINDAIATYEAGITAVWTSLVVAEGAQVVALPRDVKRIISIRIHGHTNYQDRNLSDWRLVATPQTNLLYFGNQPQPYAVARNVLFAQGEVEYEPIHHELPPDVYLLSPGLTSAVQVSGGTPAVHWKAPGYAELTSPVSGTDVREVIHYQVALPTGFTGITRNIEGTPSSLLNWTRGAVVSAIYEAPENMHRTIMSAAQGAMYEFWVRNRGLYEQYTAIASEQALDVGDILSIARAFEDKADRTYSRVKKPPRPARARVKRRQL